MSRGKRYEKSKIKKKYLIFLIIEIICIIVMIYSSYKIIVWLKENNASKKQMSELTRAVTILSDDINIENNSERFEINFEELKAKNDRVVGYLKLNGVDIEYPIVQGDDNEYYLSHSFDKSYNGAGWIFADYRNKLDGTDKNIIIYGHNRRDGSMFGSMKNVLTEEWFSVEENRKFVFITENEKADYQIFSVYKVPVEDYYITTDFINDEYDTFLKTVKDRSVFDFNTDVTSDDSIITLSTCDNNNQFRVVVHSKKINSSIVK